ncbi:MAG: LysM peptidoglycan-binding domain-containing protein [Chloroflexi bacterium]|nr:LysM peptidoglycan-binding domain-containing protein [Chloroflexota bacterium]
MTSSPAPRDPDRGRQPFSARWRRSALGGGVLAAVGVAAVLLVVVAPRAPSEDALVSSLPAATASQAESAAMLAHDNMVMSATPESDASTFAGIAQPGSAAARTTSVTYTVQPGDVLWQIAERFGLRAETILWVNGIENPDLLLAGQQLVLPPTDGVLYTVQPGERLADVAIRYGLDLSAITGANQLADPNQVQAGVDIFLPNGRPLRPAPGLAAASADTTTVQAPASGGEQQVAALPPIPLPDNIAQLLSAGWLGAGSTATLYRTAERDARGLQEIPVGGRLERLEGFSGGRIQVRSPGDGKTRQAMTGWVDANAVVVGRAPAAQALPQAYPSDTAMDIAHVFAPYRSQLDGTPYAQANCGPTTIGMALEAFGISVSSRELRTRSLDAQRMWGNDLGTLITALSDVVQSYGLRTISLTTANGDLRRWTVEDIREQIRQGRPVVVQVRYRALPGRGASTFLGDHYILVTGALNDGRFLYNDSIDADGLGWDRVLTPDRLLAAMDASDRRYAYAAFAVGR